MKWINVKDSQAPKDKPFLFFYFSGMGIGQWSQGYMDIIGNSERTHEIYYMALPPHHRSEGYEIFEWTEEKMIEMEVFWMPLPELPAVWVD